MTEIHLREYQREAIDAVFAAWGDGMTRPAIVLPTGAGKTVVFAALIKQFRAQTSMVRSHAMQNQRVIVLVHRDELADQAIAKIRAVAPDLSVGKVKAADNDTHADVMVCSVQTLAYERRLNRLTWHETKHGKVGLIITDECHHAAAASYGKVYAAFPDALQLGVTATLARGDGVGLGSVWEEVVYSKSVLWMISKGYLTDVKAKRVDIEGFDLAGLKTIRGDYQASDLGQAMEAAGADKVIATVYKEHAADRQGVVFTPTVETAWTTCEALASTGIPSAVIHGGTPRDERQSTFEGFRTGEIQVLVNCMVLTEGFDAPWASCAVIARPTQSQPLYVQMVGRVLRTWPGKTDALVLDVVGASANKLRTLIDLEPGVVQSVKEGELLADAVVREAEADNQVVPAGSIAFSLKHRDINMFAASAQAWLRTGKGVLFIDCGDTMVFLWPDDGSWAVCTISREDYRWQTPKWTEYRGLPLNEAMAWGEAVSESYASFGTTKASAWRKKKPSEKLAAYARRLGINVLETAKAGEVSDKISVVMASGIFDAHA